MNTTSYLIFFVLLLQNLETNFNIILPVPFFPSKPFHINLLILFHIDEPLLLYYSYMHICMERCIAYPKYILHGCIYLLQDHDTSFSVYVMLSCNLYVCVFRIIFTALGLPSWSELSVQDEDSMFVPFSELPDEL